MELRQPHFVLAAIACGALVLGMSAASAAPLGRRAAGVRAPRAIACTCHEIKGGPDPGNVGPPLVGHEESAFRTARN